jgi:glycosyltransferase involved in cell wall biosynthesis
MGKNSSHTPVLKKKFYPLVSVCTPTFNRRPFIPTMLQCFLNQDYPKDRMEWIIVDDGTDSIQDLIDKSNISQIKYFRQEKKMSLGEKRNFMHSKAKGTIIVYMDDDDYYPPERVSHAVDTLTNNKEAMCVGASEIYIYFKHIQKMYQSGPYGPNHATAGTFAFRTELLKHTSYENHAALAEEKHFLKDYTVPFAQLDPLKTILVFSHEHNTFDKRKLLDNQHQDYFRVCNRTVDEFIRNKKEDSIKQFFMKDIDNLLKSYKPGEPSMKPDVLLQIKQIEEERKKMMEEQGNGVPQMMINEDGKPPRPISPNEIVQLMNNQMEQIKQLTQKNQSLETMVANLQKKISQNVKNEPEEKKSEQNSSQTKSVFTDILLARINELEKLVNSLKNGLENNKLNNMDTQGISDINKLQQNIKPMIKSKTMPEVKVNIK